MRTELIDPVATEGRPGAPDHRFARWPVLSITGLVAALHLAFSASGQHWIDEVYMLAAGRFHLDWGFADQPPLVPLLAAAMDLLAPGSLLVLRLPAVLATAAAVVVTALIARELGADRRAQVLASGAAATGLWVSTIGHWLTPYAVEPLLWLLITLVLVRWIRLHRAGRDDDRLLLLLGVVVGITVQTKFQVVLLCAVLLTGVALFGPRALLRRPALWGGAGIALLIALPTLLWQAFHGWPQLAMGAVVAGESSLLSGGRAGTAASQLLYAGLAGLFLLSYGLWRLLRSAELRDYRFFAITFLFLYVFFVATAGRPYYLIGLYGIAMAAGAVGLQRRREAVRARGRTPRLSWTAWPAYALSIALAGSSIAASGGLTSLFGAMNDQRIIAETISTYRQLPAQQRSDLGLVVENYISAATIEVGARGTGVPPVHSPHRGYGYFGPPAEHVDSVLYVGKDPSRLREHFAEVRLVREATTSYWLCTGREGPWSSIWPELRFL
ncbi:glycosyltransferase family 39 protein [Saccharopolyspora sp. CA-218241]|uniref:glycosyltransferase family 39 protein n=1 Tax=Saccharopolyspora sp. CA-218241 TaxID=3240027 RepID=UPI003D971591